MLPKVSVLNRIWKAKGLWLRALLCWVLGFAFTFFDEVKQYDMRFRLRGTQKAAELIVLVYFDQEDWTAWHGQNNNLLRALKEFSITTDSFFWRAPTWNYLLEKILAQGPKNVGVAFFFGSYLHKPEEDFRALSDQRVIWAGQLDSEGRPAWPLLAGTYGNNVGMIDLREDEDRVLRRFATPMAPVPHMGLKLADRTAAGFTESQMINYRGRSIFHSVSAMQVIKGNVPRDFFKNKTVLIGSRSVQTQLYQTPLGRMNRAEILAQVTDNVLNKRWIKRSAAWMNALYLLLITIVAVFILSTYPQPVAFVFLLWLGLGSTALSLWVFDSFYFWIPALSTLAMILVTYVVFLGYQLAVKENQTWRLEQEKGLLSELDQLRNNFISLISHDLKTPIAKIQAICDRLLSGVVNTEVRDGLGNLRRESVELHRYIQSILQVSRLESSQMQVRKEPADLNELVEKVVHQVRPLSEDKRQNLVTELEPMFSIEVDGVMIQEVILNLIENGVKYTPADGRIEVRTQEVDNKVIFSVKDSGPGIPVGDRDRIFEKFFRGQAHQSQTKGTGLGLFLAKYFIELHGGEVFLESEVGKGTKVGFTLPL